MLREIRPHDTIGRIPEDSIVANLAANFLPIWEGRGGAVIITLLCRFYADSGADNNIKPRSVADPTSSGHKDLTESGKYKF